MCALWGGRSLTTSHDALPEALLRAQRRLVEDEAKARSAAGTAAPPAGRVGYGGVDVASSLRLPRDAAPPMAPISRSRLRHNRAATQVSAWMLGTSAAD